MSYSECRQVSVCYFLVQISGLSFTLAYKKNEEFIRMRKQNNCLSLPVSGQHRCASEAWLLPQAHIQRSLRALYKSSGGELTLLSACRGVHHCSFHLRTTQGGRFCFEGFFGKSHRFWVSDSIFRFCCIENMSLYGESEGSWTLTVIMGLIDQTFREIM